MNITRLLKIEYLKFSKSAVISLLVTLFVIIFPLVLLCIRDLFPELPEDIPFTIDAIYEFPTVWDYQGYLGTWLVFVFLGYIPIHSICSEFRLKTLRQSLINGLTRQEYFVTKVMSIVLIAILATLFYMLSTALIGWFNTPNPNFEKLFNNDYAGLRFFLSAFGYLSLALFMAFLIRRAGIVLFLYLSYVITIEPGIRWGIYWMIIKSKFTLYFPVNVFEDLMPFPILKFTEAMPDDLGMDWLLSYSTASIFSVLYSLLFIGLSYRIFMKRDL